MIYIGTYDSDTHNYTFDVKGSKVFEDISAGKIVYLQFDASDSGTTDLINVMLLSAESIKEDGEEDYYNFGYNSTYSNLVISSIYSEGENGLLTLTTS